MGGRWLVAVAAVIAVAGCGSSSRRASTSAVAPARRAFADAAGGFSARFSSKPREVNEPGSLGSVHLTVHFAVAHDARGASEVGATDLTPAIPQSAFAANLVAELKGVTSTSGLSLEGQPTAVRFRGQPAEQVDYKAPSGQGYRAIAFFSGGSRLFLILAPVSEFPSFSASLRIR